MKKSIFLSGMVIVLVLAFTAVATFAYFSATKDETATVTTATIGIGGTGGFPLSFTNLLPGESQSKTFNITVGGNRDADLYIQMIGSGGTDKNFCIPEQMIWLKLTNPSETVTYWNNWICPLYAGQTVNTLFEGQPTSQIAAIGTNVAPGATKNYKATLTLASTAGNDFMGGNNSDTVHLIAVQAGGPHPIPDRQGLTPGNGWTMNPWPEDTFEPDDDPNYP